jgi:hypothetical protein
LAGYRAGLKPRDVALAKSFNSDRLSQLFIKADESTLDLDFTRPFTASGLPDYAQAMLFMARGTGVECSRGLHLMPKLDYLQLLAVEWARDAAAAAGRMFVDTLRVLSDEAVKVKEGSPGVEGEGDASSLISSDESRCARAAHLWAPVCYLSRLHDTVLIF